MIPTTEELALAYRFVARRYGIRLEPDLAALAAAHDQAATLAAHERDEPAALFFALARRQRALPALWTVVVGLLVTNHIRALGLTLAGDAHDFLPLYVPVARGAMSFEDVARWFAPRLSP